METTNTSVTVAATTTAVLAANVKRISALIINNSDEVIYLALGSAAVLNKGIRLDASGGSFVLEDSDDFNGAINGISTSGSKVVTVVELAA